MSDEREDEQDPIVALNASRPKPDKRKVVGFLVFVIMLVGLLIWFFYQSTPEKPRKQEPPPTSTYNQDAAGRSRNQTGKTFHYAPSTPATPAQNATPATTTTSTTTTDDTPEPPPLPPSGRKKGTGEVTRRVVLDRSGSSLGGNGKGESLGIVPKTPASTSTSGGVFDLYAQQVQAQAAASGLMGGSGAAAGSLGSMLSSTQTESQVAARLFNRDYLLAKGAYIDCVLNTSLNSTVPGMTKCTLTRDVYSDNGVTLLLERGSEVTGEYRSNLTQGQARLFVLWDRVKTPHGVVVNLASPGTDSLGGGGVPGYVDTHFWQRFGGAMMLSLVDDLASYAANRGGNSGNSNFDSSSDTAQSMAAEALKNTINIPPTFYKNQGERIGIFIARDIDFSRVYQLQVTQ